jgi:phospholipid/cholesterol/gamma-HCH transport system substrate-binding protein
MDGVLGTKFVSIDPPLVSDGTNYKGGEQVIGVEPKGLDQFMESSTKVLGKLEGIADAFNNVFGDKEVQKSMRQGFVQAGEIAKNLNIFTKVMADSATANQQEIATMVTQLKEMSINMNQLVTAANANGATGQNVANMAADMADASNQIKEMAHSLNGVVSDPKTQKDLKETLHNAKETSVKANKILSVVTNAKVQADVMYNNKENKWRTDAGAKLPLQDNSFVYIGGADIGDANRLDLHYNRKLNNQFWMRTGVMEGEFGVGVDYNITPQLKLFTDLYDFTDAKWRVGAEYAITKNLSIIGQSFDITGNGSETTYLGVRTTF